MLKNIKSSYIFKTLLSILDEGNKLRLLKYSKNFQKKMNISLINYQVFSGRYIIYESNTKGKEYNGENDILIYEGEYLNGKRNGKGKKYYNNGNLKFEGEYLNGKIYGKGKEYSFDKLDLRVNI